jgi:hypothetical protein
VKGEKGERERGKRRLGEVSVGSSEALGNASSRDEEKDSAVQPVTLSSASMAGHRLLDPNY